MADRSVGGFTLVELLTVMAVISILLVVVSPALTGMLGAGDVTRSADSFAGLVEGGRSYAIAHNTYVWVGITEEDGSRGSANVATQGTGRIILCAVASKDGTSIYDPASVDSTGPVTPKPLDGSRLILLNKVLKIDNMHLTDFPQGTGTGRTFDTRPAVVADTAQISDHTPQADAPFPIYYPLNAATPQYTFTKVLQFNPRGEVTVNQSSALEPIVEIGLRKARGGAIDLANRDFVAIQITGIAGNLAVYRR